MMTLHHVWGWYPPQTTSYIHVRYIQSVLAIGMLSQWHMGTLIPLHRPSWPQIWEFWIAWGVKLISLGHGWGWYPPQTTSHIHIRHVQSVWATGMLSQGHIGAPLYGHAGQVGHRSVNSGSLVEWKWCHSIIIEAYIHLRPLYTSILDICKVFQPLVCCLKGIWLHPYTIFYQPSWPQIWTCGVKRMSLGHVWGWYSPQTTSNIHIRCMQSFWAIDMLSQGHMGAPLYHSTSQVGPWSGN